ncbi:LysR substrate-binding domain-containing protein [Paenibacillus massiliensis]|uniref:LysR substrate-binding domain-containing protein n=1 Tax=Paenibacillus massiliensis TaxID=225917 RepID=UPI0003F75EA6|nr:LysR substrate-binding domain-containing protein [Paenibacillus massiliensis]
MHLNLLKLHIVELLDKHQKITAVADLLGLKQPTVTFHMKNLEKEMGVKLFDARMGRILLTDAGRALLHYSVKINALANEAQRVVREFDTLQRGHISIGASYVSATYILPAILHRFSQEYPGIQISLSVKTAPVIQEKLHRREFDLGLVSTEPFTMSSLTAEQICKDELVLICAPTHPLASTQELTADILASASFILHGRDSNTRQLTDKWLDNAGRSLTSRLEMDSLEAIKQTVMLGEHVSFVSRIAVEAEVDRGQLIAQPIPDNPYERYIYLVSNSDRHRSALIQHLAGYIALAYQPV